MDIAIDSLIALCPVNGAALTAAQAALQTELTTNGRTKTAVSLMEAADAALELCFTEAGIESPLG